MTQHSSLLHFRVVELMVLNLQTGGGYIELTLIFAQTESKGDYFCLNTLPSVERFLGLDVDRDLGRLQSSEFTF